MDKANSFENKINEIKGKTIAIVYIFEGDDSSGFEHFYIWKSNIISKWMSAVQELSCMPLIIDVRTFIDKAINNTLPYIDFVINMNSGTYNLSTMALVPAMCSAMNVPCIPCDAVTIVTGENKHLSNLIASAIGLQIPKNLEASDPEGIFRPLALGNSLGVKRGNPEKNIDGIYQEFIKGIEITTPVCFNGITSEMEIWPSVAFIPLTQDLEWYYGETAKKQQKGYHFQLIELDDRLKTKYIELIKTLSIHTYCRIDARIKSCDINIQKTLKEGASIDNTYFIEINVMPTIRDNNSFWFSYNSISENTHLYQAKKLQQRLIGTISLNSFLLANCMMSFISR